MDYKEFIYFINLGELHQYSMLMCYINTLISYIGLLNKQLNITLYNSQTGLSGIKSPTGRLKKNYPFNLIVL